MKIAAVEAFALKPKIPAGVLAATAGSTVVFAATPFLVKGVAVDQDVAAGASRRRYDRAVGDQGACHRDSSRSAV